MGGFGHPHGSGNARPLVDGGADDVAIGSQVLVGETLET